MRYAPWEALGWIAPQSQEFMRCPDCAARGGRRVAPVAVVAPAPATQERAYCPKGHALHWVSIRDPDGRDCDGCPRQRGSPLSTPGRRHFCRTIAFGVSETPVPLSACVGWQRSGYIRPECSRTADPLTIYSFGFPFPHVHILTQSHFVRWMYLRVESLGSDSRG